MKHLKRSPLDECDHNECDHKCEMKGRKMRMLTNTQKVEKKVKGVRISHKAEMKWRGEP